MAVLTVVLAVAAIRGLAGARTSARTRARLQRPAPSVDLRTTASGGWVEPWLAPRLAAADVDWPAVVVIRAWVGSALGASVLAGLAGGGPLALLTASACAAGPPAVLALNGDRRERRVERELPGLLEGVARSLRSGAALPVALREAAAEPSVAAADLRAVLADTDRGRALSDSLGRWARHRPSGGVRLTVGALMVALDAGGAPARAVDGLASTLRDRLEVDREVRALATQARTSAAVVTLAPLAFAVLGMLGDERAATFLLRTGPGLACLAAGLALDAIGAWWMARITRAPA